MKSQYPAGTAWCVRMGARIGLGLLLFAGMCTTWAAPRPPAAALDTLGLSKAYFAGGPFWALEAAFENQPGVSAAIPGYMGGADTNPTYEKVIEGGTGHFLAVEVRFNPKRVRYAKLADIYWSQIDPHTRDRQFNDTGTQFHAALLYRDSAQQRAAMASLARVKRDLRKPVATGVEPAGAFLPAEDAQQDYFRKNPGRYRAWVKFSGREEALRRIWGARASARAKARPSRTPAHSSTDSP